MGCPQSPELLENTEEPQKHAKQIINLEEIMESEDLDNDYVYSLIEIQDKRIATGGGDGNITISSYDVDEKKWEKEINKEKVHDGCVTSLSTLNDNKLLSAGGHDKPLIKVWAVSKFDLTLIKQIKEHTMLISKVIPLSKERFASGSFDCTVKIWKDNNTYDYISTLQHDGHVDSILQLKGKEVLVSAVSSYINTESDETINSIFFWNTNDYTHRHTMKGDGIRFGTYMIELPDGNVVLSSDVHYPIVIIDTSTYQVKKEIDRENYFPSAMSVLDQHSFIFVCEGMLCQISNDDYSILFRSIDGNYGCLGVITIDRGKYIIIENRNRKRLTIFKPHYI